MMFGAIPSGHPLGPDDGQLGKTETEHSEHAFRPRPNRLCHNPQFQPRPAVLKTRRLAGLV
jgi:hypothetical protein